MSIHIDGFKIFLKGCLPPIMLNTYIPLVDSQGHLTGYAEKLYAHQNGLLHLAFSLVVYRFVGKRLEILLQRRAQCKYHCPGLWANTCCSHPKSMESLVHDVQRRTKEELGLSLERTSIRFLDKFIYRENVGKDLVEYEYDHVFIAPFETGSSLALNPNEVHEVKWCDLQTVREISEDTASAPWLKYIVKIISNRLEDFN